MRAIGNRVAFALALVAAGAAPAYAQWGVTASVSPAWQFNPKTANIMFNTSDAVVSGKEIRVGFLHGRTFGGDSGVDLVYRSLTTSSGLVGGGETLCVQGHCYFGTNTYQLDGATVFGLEAHKFLPFGTIKNRVQIGINLAGGYMKLRGQATEVKMSYQVDNGQVVPVSSTSQVNAIDVPDTLGGYPYQKIPTFRAELGAAVILADNLKVRVGYGYGVFDNTRVTVTVNYLFGKKGGAAAKTPTPGR